MTSKSEPCNLNYSIILFGSNFTENTDCDVLIDDTLPSAKKHIFALCLALYTYAI